MKNKLTKYCTGCGVATFGTGWEMGLCDTCWGLKKARLEYLRGEIEAERISTSEIVELQSLVDYIEQDDVQLLEWAGVTENEQLT